MEEGRLMHKTHPAMIRPAKRGEHVVTRVGDRVTSEVDVLDDTSWVVKAPTTHQEEYVLNQKKFEANWSTPGQELLQTSPNLKHLADLGFKTYWPKPGILKWMYKLKQSDLDQLPSRNFMSAWGAIQPITLGDHLVMPYPKANAQEIYLIPGDVVTSSYAKCEKIERDAAMPAGQEQTTMLWSLSFDWRTRGDIMADAELLVYGFTEPFNLLFRYQIQAETMTAWITAIAEQYKENPYHDWKHAFDVFQFVYGGLVEGESAKYFHFQDILVLLLSAISHDVGHMGLTNLFLINTQADLALRYNDKSPLESMHASVFFQTLKRPGLDFLQSMSNDNKKSFRGKVIDAILATDMSHHFEMVDRFTVRVSQAKQDTPFVVGCEKVEREAADSRMLLQAFMHMSDIGHCCRPFAIHQHLVVALEKEFFNQGDRERELGLPIMAMMDRHSDSAAACQGFFLTKMVKPLLEPYTYFQCDARGIALSQNLEDNVKTWSGLVEKHGKKPAAEIVEIENTPSIQPSPMHLGLLTALPMRGLDDSST